MEDRVIEASTCIEAEPFALQVTDDSMEPEFARGAVIIIDPTGRVTDGAFVLAQVDSGYIFRKLELAGDAARLVALNPAYPPTPLPDGLSVVRGVIVQRAGRRRSYHKRYD